MPKFSRLLVAAVLVFGASAWAAEGDTFTIKLDRPGKVGDRSVEDISGGLRVVAVKKVAGKEDQVERQTLAIVLTGTREVLALNDKGREVKQSFTVDKCTISDGNQTNEFLPKGAVIVAEAVAGADEDVYTVNGQKQQPQVAKLIGIVFKAEDPDGMSEDEVVGTDKPQKVGDTWPVNVEKAVKDMSERKIIVKPENLSGTNRLVEVAEVDGVRCYKVESLITMKQARVPQDKDALVNMEAKAVRVFPLDPTKQAVSMAVTMAFVSTAQGKDADGKDMTLENQIEMSMQSTRKAAK